MMRFGCFVFAAWMVLVTPQLHAEASEASITNELKGLRSVATDKRPAATLKVAQEIQTLPGGMPKLRLADGLAHLATEGDAGPEALQAVADALATALKENPVPAKADKNGVEQVPMPYTDLAKLVRYEGVKTTPDDPLYAKATQTLLANEAEIGKADFTLKDLHGKKYTLSELRGKIVMVNFWATWCGPCRLEMPDLDLIYTHFQSQGLVVLSISDEEAFKVNSVIAPSNYHPPVLIDADGKVHKEFHVDGIPKTFLFNRDGKLIAVAIDQRTRRQFLQMLSKTDLHP